MKVHKHRHVTSDGTEIDLTVKSRGFDWGIVPVVAFFGMMAVMAIAGIMEAPATSSMPFTRVAPVSTPFPWVTVLLSVGLGVMGIVVLLIGGVLLLAKLQERQEAREAAVTHHKVTEKRTDAVPVPKVAKVVPLRRVS